MVGKDGWSCRECFSGLEETGNARINGDGTRIPRAAGGKQAAGGAEGTIEMPAVSVGVLMEPGRDAGGEVDESGKDDKSLMISGQEVHLVRSLVRARYRQIVRPLPGIRKCFFDIWKRGLPF